MKTVFNKHFLFQVFYALIALMLFVHVCYGQKKIDIQNAKENESFLRLPDGIIKRELASFNIKASSGLDSFPKIKVNEIPLRFCKEGGVGFYKRGNRVFIHSEKFDTLGHKLFYDDTQKQHLILIDNSLFWGTDGEVPTKKIENIVYEHIAYAKYLPDSAFKGLYEPNLCEKAHGKKRIAYSKVFQSVDRRRIYIYMLNGSGAGSYEVTWVLQNGKYYTRVIDPR